MKVLHSFGYAFQGLWRCMNYERNMRIHIVAAAFILIFSLFFSLTGVEYAILFVLIGLVMALELLNTALEAVGNAISKEKNPYVKIIKDTAAGAVLILAIAAVAVAAVFFWEPEGFVRIYRFFTGQPLWFIPLGLGGIASLIFIWRGPLQLFAPKKYEREK